MPEPAFSSSDRVPTGGLPKELEGKSAAEVAAYYQQELERTRTAARQAIASATSGVRQPNEPVRPVETTPRPTLTKEQFWNDPVAAVQQLNSGVLTQQQFEQLTTPFVEQMSAFAEQTAKSGKPYWDKYSAEIHTIMQGLTPQQRATTNCWVIAYQKVIGEHVDDIAKEAVTRATAPPSTLPPSGAPTEPPAPVDLNTITAGHKKGVKTAAQVAEGLGLSQDSYRKGMERVGADSWPLTMDNRR